MEKLTDTGFLRRRGWRRSPKGWSHPALSFPWPVRQAKRLEEERSAGDEQAAELLGLKVEVPDELPADIEA